MLYLNLSVRTFLSFLVLAVLSVVHAETMIPPPGLNDGDQYRLFFMTSGARDATSVDIEDYNEFVQSHVDRSPELAALGLEWNAVVSTPTVAARDNTGTNHEVDSDGVPVYLVNGTLLASNNVRLWVDHGRELLNISEFGDIVPIENPARPDPIVVWSGSLQDGTIDEALGSVRPGTGIATGGGSLAFTNSRDDSDQRHHLYAMSSVLTVPEPSFNFLWLTCMSAFARRRQGRR